MVKVVRSIVGRLSLLLGEGEEGRGFFFADGREDVVGCEFRRSG